MLYFWPIERSLIGAVATQKHGYSIVAGVLVGANLGTFAFLLFMITGIFHLPRSALVYLCRKRKTTSACFSTLSLKLPS